MKKNHRKLIGIMLITSLLIAGCGAAKSEPAPAKEEAQTQVAEAPAAEEQTSDAETPAAEEQVTETQEAATAETPAPEPEAENAPEDDTVIPDGSEVTESELDDGTISTEIIKPDGSIKLILEDPDGGKKRQITIHSSTRGQKSYTMKTVIKKVNQLSIMMKISWIHPGNIQQNTMRTVMLHTLRKQKVFIP